MKIRKGKVIRAAAQALGHSLRTLPYDVAGLVVVPFLWKYRDIDYKVMRDNHPRLLPWINAEDWTGGIRGHQSGSNCMPADLWDEMGDGRWGFYRYHALRNKAAGLRHMEKFVLRLSAAQIHYITPEECEWYQDWWLYKYKNPKPGNTFWHLTWQRDCIGFEYIRYFVRFGKFRWYRCKLGWRIGPGDRHGYNPKSARWVLGATPTFQILKFGIAGEDYK